MVDIWDWMLKQKHNFLIGEFKQKTRNKAALIPILKEHVTSKYKGNNAHIVGAMLYWQKQKGAYNFAGSKDVFGVKQNHTSLKHLLKTLVDFAEEDLLL